METSIVRFAERVGKGRADVFTWRGSVPRRGARPRGSDRHSCPHLRDFGGAAPVESAQNTYRDIVPVTDSPPGSVAVTVIVDGPPLLASSVIVFPVWETDTTPAFEEVTS